MPDIIRPLNVLKLYCDFLKGPSKDKFLIILDDDERPPFFLINSNSSSWALPIPKKENSFLSYNSYICCHDLKLSFTREEILHQCRKGYRNRICGKVDLTTQKNIVNSIATSSQIKPIDKKALLATLEPIVDFSKKFTPA